MLTVNSCVIVSEDWTPTMENLVPGLRGCLREAMQREWALDQAFGRVEVW